MSGTNFQQALAATASQEREMWGAFAALGLLLALLVAAIIVGRLAARVTRVRAARRAERQAARAASSYGFPVVTEAAVPLGPTSAGQAMPVQEIGRGPGRYRIVGVVAATGTDIQMYVDAATPANAKVKAELKGVVVTEVEKQ